MEAGPLSSCLAKIPEFNRKGEPGSLDGIVGRPQAYLKSVLPRGFSPHALREFRLCPFRFFASRVLNLGEPEEPGERGEVDPRLKGRAYHAVLEEFHRRLRKDGWWEKAGPWQPHFEAAFSEVMSEWGWRRMGLYPLLWESERRKMRMHLERFIPRDLYEARACGFLPADFEVELAADCGGITLRGRPDRVDFGLEGSARVVDYKMRAQGSSLATRIRAMDELQPPIYLELVKADPSLAREPAGACYWFLEDSEEYTGRADRQDFGRQEWLAVREGFLRNVREFAAMISEGAFPITPDETEHGACSRCPFDGLCRKAHPPTRWRASSSKAVERLEAALRIEAAPAGKKAKAAQR